jgi:beta-galactosidase
MTLALPSQLFYGGDYNPEQWSREVWLEDMRLMREAGVNLVTLGVFSWANIETSDGVYEFGWLDEIINLLHENGIGVDLATATASPPAWLTISHPEVLPVNYHGTRLSHGGRQGYCISSPIYKAKSGQLARKLAERYASHPAIKMWHVNNEYGCHNPICYCDVSALAWRVWLQKKYQNLDELNLAWGTNFWSQRYHRWEEILPPRETPVGTYPNPSMVLDYRRFSNDEILDLYLNERDEIRALDAVHPITTNFMSMKHTNVLDYWQWAGEVDFVATDHYLMADDRRNYVDLAFQADLTRGFAGGKPWLLMDIQPARSTGRKETSRRLLARCWQILFRTLLAVPTARCSSNGVSQSAVPRSFIQPWFLTPARRVASGETSKSWVRNLRSLASWPVLKPTAPKSR